MKTTYNINAIVSIKLITKRSVPFYQVALNHKVGWSWARKVVPSVLDFDEYIEINKFFNNEDYEDYCYYPNDNHIYYKPYVEISFNNGETHTEYFENAELATNYYNKLQTEFDNNKIEFND